MRINIPHVPIPQGHVENVRYGEALALGADVGAAGAALKLAALEQVKRVAESYRVSLGSASPGKLQAFRIMARIAADPAAADADQLARIARIAAAHGRDLDAQLAVIRAKTIALEGVAIEVEAIEAETHATITAIPDDAPDIEAQIATALRAASAQAEAAAQAVVSAMGGAE